MAYNSGDDINAVVVALGAYTVKAGDAGEDSPKAVFPSKIGYVDAQHVKAKGSIAPRPEEADADAMDIDSTPEAAAGRYFDSDIDVFKEYQTVESPFDSNGVVSNWDLAGHLVDHAFTKLGIDSESIDRPLLFTESTFSEKGSREKMTEFLFERYKPTGLFVGKDATLSSFASGRSSSVVLDCGETHSTAAIVHDGYVLKKCTVYCNDVGGRKLSELVQRLLKQKSGQDIRPRYLFEKKKGKGGRTDVKQITRPNATPSYHEYQLRSILDDVKIAHCKVAAKPVDDSTEISISTVEFPDGTSVQMDKELLQVPEALFRPSLFPETAKNNDNTDRLGIVEMVNKIVSEADADLKRDLYQNTIITGGSSMFSGFTERFQGDLSALTPSTFKLKLIAPASSSERKFANWIGGSILASLGSFHQMWISKAEYDEVGSGVVHKKCP